METPLSTISRSNGSSKIDCTKNSSKTHSRQPMAQIGLPRSTPSTMIPKITTVITTMGRHRSESVSLDSILLQHHPAIVITNRPRPTHHRYKDPQSHRLVPNPFHHRPILSTLVSQQDKDSRLDRAPSSAIAAVTLTSTTGI